MKSLFFILAAFAVCLEGRGQSNSSNAYNLPLDEVLKPNQLFHDAMYGLLLNYPEGWKVRGGYQRRWNDPRENIVILTPSARSKVEVTIYYQMFSEFVPPPDFGPIEAILRETAETKAESRIASRKFNRYKNEPDSFKFSEVEGRATLKNFATFFEGRQPRLDYFIRTLGPRGYVMFFVTGPAADVKSVVTEVDRMAASVRGSLIEVGELQRDPLDWLLTGR